jgi:hypothetical protein
MRVMMGLLLWAALLAAPLGAQDARDMDVLLETAAVDGARGARFVLGAAGLLPAGLSGPAAEAAAWGAARERGWVSGSPDRVLRLKDAAFLVMGAFGLKGGLMYSLFPGPRYAYRELLYRTVIQGRADGGAAVSGERLLQIIGRVSLYTGEDGRLDAELAAGAAEEKMEVPAGKGLSGGPEEILPYGGEFILE